MSDRICSFKFSILKVNLDFCTIKNIIKRTYNAETQMQECVLFILLESIIRDREDIYTTRYKFYVRQLLRQK